jgi:ABC-type multidrug transport system ATPase subunit
MKSLIGSVAADSGTLVRRGTIGYCPQDPVLYERLTCDEHFALFGRAYGLTDAATTANSAELYATFGFGEWANSRVERLSGGTRSKLNLGLALLSDPDVLLLDEPYAGFDYDTYQRFWVLTRERRDQGRALLIVSHFITDVERFDRIYDLRDGRTVER